CRPGTCRHREKGGARVVYAMTVIYFATVSETVVDQLDEVVDAVVRNPSIAAKRAIGLVSDVLGTAGWVDGPGDDGAAVDVEGKTVIACGEALWPPFVRTDPFGAGLAAVLTNVNDVAAMGGLPLA